MTEERYQELNHKEEEQIERGDAISAIVVAIIFVAMVIVLLVVPGKACPEQPASAEPEYAAYYDTTYWAQEKGTGELGGQFSPCEMVEILPFQDGCGRIRGFLPGGYCIRVAARMKVMMLDDVVYGLRAADNTMIWIRKDRVKLAETILLQEYGEETEVCGGSVSLALIHCDGGTITERLCRSWDGYIEIGKVFFNTDITDGDMLLIVAFDWDGDGDLELCLVAASAPEEVKEPEPEISANTEKNNADEKNNCTETAQTVKKQECLKIEFNLHFLIQYCQKWFGK